MEPEMTAVASLPEALDPKREPRALINHILQRYHDTHRRELPELIRLAGLVEEAHAGHPDLPDALVFRLKKMRGELEAHMKKEELMLFPMMRQGLSGRLFWPITQMRLDHEEHEVMLDELKSITGAFQAPAGACRTWQALYRGLEKLCADLEEHIAIENDILFAAFE